MVEPHANDDTRLSRRHALQAIVQVPILAYGLTSLEMERSTPLPPAEEVLPLLASGLTSCKALLAEGDFATLFGALKKYLPILEHLAQQSSKQQQVAAHLTSQAYLLAVMIADQYRKLDHMETFSREARQYGRLAGDPNLEVSALARLAVKFGYEHRSQKAVSIYQEALDLPLFKQVSPLLRGRIYGGLAGESAVVQQNTQATFFLGCAKDIFPDTAENDPCFSFAYCGNDTLFLWEGLTYKHLGRYTDAWNAFLVHGKLQIETIQQPLAGFHDRNRAEFLTYAASVAVKQRQLDASSLYLQAAEEIAWKVKHEQRYMEVLETLRDIETLWPHEPIVKQLRDKIRARQG